MSRGYTACLFLIVAAALVLMLVLFAGCKTAAQKETAEIKAVERKAELDTETAKELLDALVLHSEANLIYYHSG